MKELEQLIEKCIKNDRSAQYQLFQQFQPYIKVLCKRYLADKALSEDINQEIWLKVFKYLKYNFDSQKSGFKTWITNIAIRRIFDENKKKSSSAKVVELNPSSFIYAEQSDQTMQMEVIHFVINKLPPDQAEVFQLFIMEGYSHDEISEIKGISSAVSRKRLSRAKENIRTELEGMGNFHLNKIPKKKM